MISRLRSRFQLRWSRWVKKRSTAGNPQLVDQRNLYILPTPFGWAYGVVVFAMLLGAVNYQVNTIFLLTILLSIIGMVSACEAHGNLLNLSFKLVDLEDAEQGTPVKATIFVNANEKVRFSVGLSVPSQPQTRLEKITLEGLTFILPIATTVRGRYSLAPIVITSEFPFGIFGVWSYACFEAEYYVYPQPVDPGYWPEPLTQQQSAKLRSAAGDEEFYDVNQVQNPWSEPKLISWKLVAKGQGWYLKRMNSNEMNQWIFKLSDLPADNIELNLQHLSFWLQTAEAEGLTYGLDLKGTPTGLANGKEHLMFCLRQLALY